MRIAATQTFPGPAWDELPDVELLERGRRRSRCPASTCRSSRSIARSGRRSSTSSPTSASSRTTASATTSSTSRRAAGAAIAVTNTPGVLDAAVADLTLALILATAAGTSSRRDRLDPGGRLAARLGAPRAPRARSRRLARSASSASGGSAARSRAAPTRSGWGSRTTRRSGGVPLDELLASSDVVSLHVPLTRARRAASSRASGWRCIQDGATLVNTARGAVVDEEALVDGARLRPDLGRARRLRRRAARPRARCSASRTSSSRRTSRARRRDASGDDARARRQRARLHPRRVSSQQGLGTEAGKTALFPAEVPQPSERVRSTRELPSPGRPAATQSRTSNQWLARSASATCSGVCSA